MRSVSPRIVSIFIFILFFLAGCLPNQADSTSAPFATSPTFTNAVPTATATVTATFIPMPSPTPTLDPAVQQLDLLYQASLSYLAETDEQAWEVAKRLGYAPLGGYPSNMCGPLAVSMLKDAGLMGQDVDLHDFWLLNPLVDGDLLKNVFPVEHYLWLHTDMPINQIDYRQFPLQAGDLVYIYSGKLGDYSHVLTVTRVDEQDRAYSVTNNYTADGFIILEYLLYDPAIPGEGIFYAWTDPANLELGITGLGGMDVWRPLQLPYYPDGAP